MGTFPFPVAVLCALALSYVGQNDELVVVVDPGSMYVIAPLISVTLESLVQQVSTFPLLVQLGQFAYVNIARPLQRFVLIRNFDSIRHCTTAVGIKTRERVLSS